MKKFVVSLVLVLSCLSLRAMEISQENTRLCQSFWEPKIEASENKRTEILESLVAEAEENKKDALRSLEATQSLRVSKQREARLHCIRKGLHESLSKYSNWF